MTGDQPLRVGYQPATDPLREATQAAGSGEAVDGGDPACWAFLVCEECGAVVSEGHRAGCSRSAQSAGPSPAGPLPAGPLPAGPLPAGPLPAGPLPDGA
jgi:hypothetical protein